MCDDGSLKIYVADTGKTDFWLQPHLKQTNPIVQLKSNAIWSSTSLFQLSDQSAYEFIRTNALKVIKHQITTASLSPSQAQTENTEPGVSDSSKYDSSGQSGAAVPGQLKRTNAIRSRPVSARATPLTGKDQAASSASQASAGQLTTTGQAVKFPIDYFEKCFQLNECDFGGNDLLEIYNSSLLKSRLNFSSSSSNFSNKFIACTRADGFNLEIYNNADLQRLLLIGCRILCGGHTADKAPFYFEVFDRRIDCAGRFNRQKWVDICLTREEAMIADNKLVLRVGPSSDQQRHLTIIEACICYAKRKDQLKWSKQEALNLQKAYMQTKTTTRTNASGAGTSDSAEANANAASGANKKVGAMTESTTSSISAALNASNMMDSLFLNAPANSNVLLNQFQHQSSIGHSFGLHVEQISRLHYFAGSDVGCVRELAQVDTSLDSLEND